MGGERTVHDHRAAGCERAGDVGAKLAGGTMDRLGDAFSAGDLRNALAHILVVAANHPGATQRLYLRDGGAAAHDIDRPEAEMLAKLQDHLPDSRTGRSLQEPLARLD